MLDLRFAWPAQNLDKIIIEFMMNEIIIPLILKQSFNHSHSVDGHFLSSVMIVRDKKPNCDSMATDTNIKIIRFLLFI